MANNPWYEDPRSMEALARIAGQGGLFGGAPMDQIGSEMGGPALMEPEPIDVPSRFDLGGYAEYHTGARGVLQDRLGTMFTTNDFEPKFSKLKLGKEAELNMRADMVKRDAHLAKMGGSIPDGPVAYGIKGLAEIQAINESLREEMKPIWDAMFAPPGPPPEISYGTMSPQSKMVADILSAGAPGVEGLALKGRFAEIEQNKAMEKYKYDLMVNQMARARAAAEGDFMGEQFGLYKTAIEQDLMAERMMDVERLKNELKAKGMKPAYDALEDFTKVWDSPLKADGSQVPPEQLVIAAKSALARVEAAAVSANDPVLTATAQMLRRDVEEFERGIPGSIQGQMMQGMLEGQTATRGALNARTQFYTKTLPDLQKLKVGLDEKKFAEYARHNQQLEGIAQRANNIRALAVRAQKGDQDARLKLQRDYFNLAKDVKMLGGSKGIIDALQKQADIRLQTAESLEKQAADARRAASELSVKTKGRLKGDAQAQYNTNIQRAEALEGQARAIREGTSANLGNEVMSFLTPLNQIYYMMNPPYMTAAPNVPQYQDPYGMMRGIMGGGGMEGFFPPGW